MPRTDGIQARNRERETNAIRARMITSAERAYYEREAIRLRTQQALLRAAMYERHPELKGPWCV